MVTMQASPPSLQPSCNSDDLKEKENEGGRRRRRNRCRKKLEIARAAKSLTPQENKMHTKDTRASVRVLDGPLEFWNVKPTELGIMFFLSVFGAGWIGVFNAIYWRLGWLCFENLGMLL